MAMWVTLVLLIFGATAHARKFSNPVIDNQDVPDPGVLKVNGVYYAVTTTNDGNGHKFAIHSSSDLQNWARTGFVFNVQTRPSWALKDDAFWAPELHQIGDKFLCYFTARDAGNNALSVGVAVADHVLGPYRSLGEPLLTNPAMGSMHATLMRNGSDIYLVWKDDGNGANPPQPTWIWARRLNGDGLSFDENDQHALIRNDLGWEESLVEGIWHVERDGWHYLFYSGNGNCRDVYAIGVARSRDPLGPYEKLGDPILKSDNNFIGPGHCSVVRDVNDSDYVMIYYASFKGTNCNPRVMMATSISWDDNGWPYVSD